MSTHSFSPEQAGVIIPAGGIGSRLGHIQPKQFLHLEGRPILVRTCQVFLQHPAIKILIVVIPASHAEETRHLLRTHLNSQEMAHIHFTLGGQTRQDSVAAGLRTMPQEIDLILVHDAARPLISSTVIDRCLDGAICHGAVIAAVPVKDTLKRTSDGSRITATIDRNQLWQAQTPQAARRHLLEQAFAQAEQTGFQGTDEASLLEAAGIPVQVVQGSEQNLKITHPEDLRVATALFQQGNSMKIGHGFDAHRLVPDRLLILGGVPIPYELGLAGHSDADVVAHALSDALLGAMGAGDIGRHFPDTDPQYKGADSLKLLEQVRALADQQGLRLGNADITIVCQRPKLAPHLAAMRMNLARCCKVEPEAINIKATTTEQMGYAGRGEGIATHAVVLLRSDHGN